MKSLLMLIRILKSKGYIWLPGYLFNREYHRRIRNNNKKDIHLMFLVVDHFEPSRSQGNLGIQRVKQWCNKYEEIAKLHTDSDGRFPQHTWFYRYDYPSSECVNILSDPVFKGFGEIEFHLHHGNDNPRTFEQKIIEGLNWFNSFGAMISAEVKPERRFGYIAGNWALDNGRKNPAFSGVNTELSILNKTGCYADFTFPAIDTNAQPRKVNSIYYATDTPKPKSYDTGVDVARNAASSGDLMIFQGPVYIDWKEKYIESASFETFAPYSARRIENWLRAGIHVAGRPEWIFIKVHTHGMQSRDVFLGNGLNNMLSDLEKRFKEAPYHLHYVTAREAYNIAKAAEADMQGDPDAYRDFAISKPVNRQMYCNYPYHVKKASGEELIIKIKDAGDNTVLQFNDLPLKSIEGGSIKKVEVTFDCNSIKRLLIDGSGKGIICFRDPNDITSNDMRQTMNIPFSSTEFPRY